MMPHKRVIYPGQTRIQTMCTYMLALIMQCRKIVKIFSLEVLSTAEMELSAIQMENIFELHNFQYKCRASKIMIVECNSRFSCLHVKEFVAINSEEFASKNFAISSLINECF